MGDEQKTIFRLWIFLKILCYSLGVAYVAGNQCDTEDVRLCYEDLVQYETIVFPLYGENEARLDDTCGNMNISFNCIRSYVETCHGSGECDINCTKLIKEIHSFLRISGLMKLYENLCEKSNALRQMYLESAECLEDTADLYAACHNVSQESRHYMHTTDGANTIEGNCCYLSWYRDCFTNTTRNNCGENATIIVSIAAHLLLGEISDQLCSSEPAFCDTPPLPTDTSPTDNEIDKSSYPNDHELDKDKPDETDNEIDNTIDDTKNAATTLYASTVIVLPYVFSILFKYIL